MRTPAYVFFKDQIIGNYQRLQQVLPLCEVYYALKANSELEILSVLHEAGSKFDVASEEEFVKLIQLGVSPDRILCSLPVKSEELIDTLYQGGCRYFVFDHPEELLKLREHAQGAKKVLRVYVTDQLAHDIEYGMTLEEFLQLKEQAPERIDEMDGVTFYSSGSEKIEHFSFLLDRCDQFLREMNPAKELIVNIGGSYQLNETMDEEYYRQVTERLQSLKDKYAHLRCIVEPGKGIMNTAGALLARVVMVKERDGHYDVYIDAGDPSGAFKKPTRITKYQGELNETKRRQVYRFVGTTCNHRVLFIVPLKFEIQKGDILMMEGYGSYSICYSSQFHAWRKPDVIMKERLEG